MQTIRMTARRTLPIAVLGLALGPVALWAQPTPPAARAAQQPPPAARTAPASLDWDLALAQDPADSLYRTGRQALATGDYRRAVNLLRLVRERYPRASVTGDALYWEAFARYRIGSTDDLRMALQVLEEQRRMYAGAGTRREADALAVRIQGALAQRGDAAAAEAVTRAAERVAPTPPPPVAATAPRPAVAPTPPPPVGPGPVGVPPAQRLDESDDIRVAALNALMQMDAERAIPILRQVLVKRDAGSVELRKKAVFVVAQQKSSETTDIMLDVARNDPSTEVQAQAVFWLSQVKDERAVSALDSILMQSGNREVQEKAIFALSQHRSERAGEALRRYAERQDVPADLREKSIFWLGQHRSPENQAFLRSLYPRVGDTKLKERIIFAVSQNRDPENRRWLMDVALDRNESLEMRKKALFWAGQSRDVQVSELSRLYDTMGDVEMREQIIFTVSQRKEPEAVDLLMKIAENDPDPKLRSKAVFWLGQSKDPRVPDFLLRLLNKP